MLFRSPLRYFLSFTFARERAQRFFFMIDSGAYSAVSETTNAQSCKPKVTS